MRTGQGATRWTRLGVTSSRRTPATSRRRPRTLVAQRAAEKKLIREIRAGSQAFAARRRVHYDLSDGEVLTDYGEAMCDGSDREAPGQSVWQASVHEPAERVPLAVSEETSAIADSGYQKMVCGVEWLRKYKRFLRTVGRRVKLHPGTRPSASATGSAEDPFIAQKFLWECLVPRGCCLFQWCGELVHCCCRDRR